MKLNITVDGKTYEVDVEASEPERPVPVTPRAQVTIPASSFVVPPAAPVHVVVEDESKVSRSPVNGTVVQVLSEPGQAVVVGDVLMVLEAMKMETNIAAPIESKIASINATVGDAVKAGQILIEFE